MLKRLLYILAILFSSTVSSQLSKTHYIPPITSGISNAIPNDQYIYISTPSDGLVNFSIKRADGVELQSGQVSNNDPYPYTISTNGYSEFVQDATTTGQVNSDKGFIIEADRPIYVSVRLNAGGSTGSSAPQAGALVSKGENALGTSFRVGTFTSLNGNTVVNNQSNYLSFFSFMATEDNTTIDLTNERVTSSLVFEGSGTGSFPVNNIILNRGQSYVVAIRIDKNTNISDGLIGTLISSDKPIVVNTGSSNGSFAEGGSRDYGIDQIVGADKVGNEYIFVKGNGGNSFENVLIIANEDDTQISVNGTSQTPINAGEYYLFEGNLFIDNNMYISTNKNVFAYQGVGGTTSEANQGMFFVPPLNCGSQGDVDNIPEINRIGSRNFSGGINIITKKDGAEILINDLDIGDLEASVQVVGPTGVTGNDDYVTYKITGLTGNISVKSGDELYVSYFNANGVASSGSFFSGFASNPSLDLDLTASKLGSCISENGTSNVVLEVNNDGNFDSLQWEKKNTDGSWFSISGETNTSFTPNEIGTYRVKGISECDDDTVEYYSSEIPISICPVDFDNDGIIDNIDLDHDNDGILNSVESRGIGNIDFSSDTASPTITLSDGTAINGIISGSIEKSDDAHTVTGQNNSFEMQVESGVDQQLKYILSFNEKLNINIIDNPNVSVAIRNGESFVIKSFPASSNITILDPSDNLLIDTNFDDDFEENITEFTSNEIRFKFNSNSTTTINYEFFATKVEGITFTHNYSTTETGESIFVPNIYVYDYYNDTDVDELEDMFDPDSDNDDCKDIIEADFTSLSNFEGDDDNDGIYGTGEQTFDNGKINDRGLVKVHFDEGGYAVDPKKDSDDNYLFQTEGEEVSIVTQPINQSGCEDSTIEFNIEATSNSGQINYQWQFSNDSGVTWANLENNSMFSGVDTEKLTISNATTEQNGNYRVSLNSEFYLCETLSIENVTLAVNEAPDPAIVQPIQTFCASENPTVGDLQISDENPPGLTINVYDDYDPNDTSIGNLLESSTLLVDGQTYYIEVVDELGCVSVTKSQTKALVPDPIISSNIEESCAGDGVEISISGIPQTALDFQIKNSDLVKIAEYENSTYFVDPVSRTFFESENLIPTYGDGASLYQINTLEEHNAVYNALNNSGYVNEPLWLGLKQFPALNPNNRFDGGWYWLDGRPLDSSWNLWNKDSNGNDVEPNDYDFDPARPDDDGIDDGSEDYGHFNLSGSGIYLNDYPGTINSRPLYEFTGTTTVKWYYEESTNPGVRIPIDSNTSSIYVTPTVTTTYYIDVTTNGVLCTASYTHTVNPNPTAETIPDYVFCDDETDDDGTNGSITLSENDFTSLIPSILGDEQSSNDFSVSFYLSKEEVESGDNPITFPYTSPTKESSALHWESISTPIYVRVTNNLTGCINFETEFNLVVNPLPITFEVEDIVVCDDGENVRDGVSTFDLELRTSELRSGNETTDPNDEDNQSPDNFPVTYYLSLDDANNSSDAITSPYETSEVTIFYRIEKLDNDGNLICFKTGEAFDLIVQELPVANEVSISRQCDGDSDLDTNSQDGIFPFDTSGIQNILLSGQENVTTYYYNENDELIGNTLPEIFETGSQIITIHVENNTPEKCYDETTLEFIVDDSPEAYEVIISSQCDDGPSDIDGFSEFDTSSITETLLTNPANNQMQSLDDYSVEYQFLDENGNTITASSLPNPFNTKTQTVIAKITNNINNTCIISEEIQFTVDPLPVINNNLITIKQCDDGEGAENDGITLHDLTESQLLFSENYANEIFEYYEDEGLTEKIEDPTFFYNDPLYDEIWVKIISEDGCERITKTQNGDDRLKIEITVGASQISPTFMEDNNTFYTICEDSPSDNQDGISVFSNSVIQEIYNKLVDSREIFQQQNIRVTLHTLKDDANTGNNPIDLNQNFTNIIPNTQEIWARIINVDVSEGDLQCLGFAQVGELYVEPRPIANSVTIDRQCDGDSPDDLDSQDGKYPFDVSLIESQVILDQTDVSVSYFNKDGTEIENFGQSLFLTESQTITIVVEKEPSYPDITNPDGLCYDETTLEFIVDDSPEAYPVVLDPHCDGDDGGIDNDGYDTFDTSDIIDTILTNPETGITQDLTKLNIEFTFVDENGNTITDSQLPNPFITATQTVTFTVENPLNTNCIITDEIDFVVNPLPEFTVDDDTIVCLNLPAIPIGVTSSEAEYTYSWVHEDLNGNSSPFPSTEDTIFIGVGGTYYVTATTTDGTNCSRTLSINVEESIIATINLDDITVKDLTNDNNNTITIDTTNLGIGDYEFAIDDPSGPYQDEPFFEQVRPGIHTIYVRDKNDCGIAQIDVSVIGYKKFFTPNNDGIHDTWRILGIREDFQPNSKVYIFDRYGKLLKELDPVGEGWDGTFIGRPMPQSDYWFRVFLEDGREFKGHFSLVRGFD